MAKKTKRSKDNAKAKDLAPRKRSSAAVKGGGVVRITNVRANASGISSGPSGTPAIILEA
jgi:hypothetical protein